MPAGILLVLFIAGLVLVYPDMDPALAVVILVALMLVVWITGPREIVHEKRRHK